ncbi:MAG: threonine--tRNA ligase [Spirochaetes bacterium]|nr:MAG: threonine--tRNA ligase [Spirochaetota bacterium]
MSGQVTITLPDNSTLSVEKGTSVYDIIGMIGKRLQGAALVAGVNGKTMDLNAKIEGDAALKVFTFDSPEGKDALLHSASHLMAQAIKRLFPGVKFAIGPSIENGYYYDMEAPRGFVQEDLAKIEAEMEKIVKEDIEIVREEMPLAKARELFASQNETYKIELLETIEGDSVSLYRQGEFVDLCRGPHVRRTSQIKAFKLLSIAGAYWRGDEKRAMLSRIYGTAWASKEQLDAHLKKLDEIERRDHRRLGKQLELFSVHDETGAGLILWHPKGARLRNILENFWREEHYKNGYDLVFSPHIGKSQLWEISGHLGFYRENMYSPMDIDGQEYFTKPMNCPFHIVMYKNRSWSYRDLPLRWAELGTVYRYERSGVLHGLLRVRGFTQDDAHLFCRPDQMPEEIDRVLAFCLSMLRAFGFEDFTLYLATRPAEKSVGEPQQWADATRALEESLKRAGIGYEVDEGGGAFYGPKIDIKIKDALGREWQCSTIQFDFNMTERFDVTYIDRDGKKHRPYMIHRALMGSLERFIGILIEHYEGRFPLWLAPVQVMLLSVTEDAADRVSRLRNEFMQEGIRAEADIREETIGYKIRDAIEKRVPFIGVVGKKEIENDTVSVRRRGEQQSTVMKREEFSLLIKEESARKK